MFDLVLLVKAIGYLGVFLIVFAESGVLIGFFLPGDSLIFTVGFLSSQGYLNIVPAIVIIFLGAVAGDSIGYSLGKKFGPSIFKSEDSFFLHKDNIERAKKFYEKHGGKTIILARFLPFIRTLAPVLAGVGKMHYPSFVTYNILGGALWATGLTLVGYFLGEVLPNADNYILLIVAGIIIFTGGPVILRVLKDKKTRERIIEYFKNKKSSK
ncbi:MAG: DedA family protein [Candidatus Paceibacterota bacterium]|jgi:membrane-associated protein